MKLSEKDMEKFGQVPKQIKTHKKECKLIPENIEMQRKVYSYLEKPTLQKKSLRHGNNTMTISQTN